MHSPGHRWTSLVLIVTVALTLGCRGSRPFGRFVQVTQEAESNLPEVDAPRQRLATTKPRIETEVTMTKSGRPDLSASSRSAAATRELNAQTAMAQRNAIAAQKQQRTTASQATNQTIAHTSKPAARSRQSETRTKVPARQSSDPSSMNNKELIAAFDGYTPEVRQEIMRRLAASETRNSEARNSAARNSAARNSEARSIEQTSQPKGLDRELARNVMNLPELPDAKSGESGAPPVRIASDDSEAPAVASLTDNPKTDATAGRSSSKAGTAKANDSKMANSENRARSGVEARVTDLVTSELESSSVQTISDSNANDTTAVKTASLSREASDDSMVAQAVEPIVTQSRRKSSDEAGSAEGLSKQKLYAELLKRLSTPKPDESEAERNSRLIAMRHLLVLSGDPDKAVEAIDGMPEAEQEYFRHQLLGLWTMVDPNGHPIPSRRFTTALPQLREATKFAAAATDALDIQSLEFCTEIESYGQIKTFPGNRFDAGQQVILYCEIENFSVAKTEEGFETHLQGSYDVYNSDNEKIVSQLLPADKQVSANYLRDYFIAYQMHLPQQLAAGTYRLQLTMEDVGGKKYGQSSIPFEIAK